jgi:hypothetical protein
MTNLLFVMVQLVVDEAAPLGVNVQEGVVKEY